MKKELIIDGNNFSNAKELDLEFKKILTKDIDWINYSESNGLNLDSLNDFLQGGFGVFEVDDSIKITWLHSQKSKDDLGKDETITYLKQILVKSHPSAHEKIEQQIKLMEVDQGKTLFDMVVEVIKEHDHIELVLE
jgi:RNAse (barnase) inhibitor barstar